MGKSFRVGDANEDGTSMNFIKGKMLQIKIIRYLMSVI